MHTYDRNYFKIALPAALEGLFMILLASTDLIMVGALGALSIAAVSIFMRRVSSCSASPALSPPR